MDEFIYGYSIQFISLRDSFEANLIFISMVEQNVAYLQS